jgi:hypothetical protein
MGGLRVAGRGSPWRQSVSQVRSGGESDEVRVLRRELTDLSAPRGQIGQSTLARLEDCPFFPISAGKSAKERGARAAECNKAARGRLPRSAQESRAGRLAG